MCEHRTASAVGSDRSWCDLSWEPCFWEGPHGPSSRCSTLPLPVRLKLFSTSKRTAFWLGGGWGAALAAPWGVVLVGVGSSKAKDPKLPQDHTGHAHRDGRRKHSVRDGPAVRKREGVEAVTGIDGMRIDVQRNEATGRREDATVGGNGIREASVNLDIGSKRKHRLARSRTRAASA